jgi:hypothetical protein
MDSLLRWVRVHTTREISLKIKSMGQEFKSFGMEMNIKASFFKVRDKDMEFFTQKKNKSTTDSGKMTYIMEKEHRD